MTSSIMNFVWALGVMIHAYLKNVGTGIYFLP